LLKKKRHNRACVEERYGGDERCIQSFSGETREGDHLEDPGIDVRIILKWILEKWNGAHGLV
jgi:hypothetical protein